MITFLIAYNAIDLSLSSPSPTIYLSKKYDNIHRPITMTIMLGNS